MTLADFTENCYQARYSRQSAVNHRP